MTFSSELKRLLDSEEFKEWQKNNKDSYLTYGFIMISPEVKKEWQIGFYNPKRDTISTFTLGNEVIKNPEAEVFKDEKKVIELDVEKIKITLNKALILAEELQVKKYPQHKALKTMVIIQNLGIGQVWNITYITNTFKTLNIKIDSASGKAVKHDLIELFKFDK